MNKLIFTFLLLSAPAFAKEYTIEMKSISYAPKTIQIAVGDSIQWQNVSYTDHSATGDGFDTGMVHPKEKSKVIVFSKPGTYAYQCHMHGKAMMGTITVGAAQ
jgi:plastocyanin